MCFFLNPEISHAKRRHSCGKKKELDDNKILSSTKKTQIKDEKVSSEIDVKKISINGFENVKQLKLVKYWLRKEFLFTKFDEGIALDAESWYSVTPESIAKQIAERCSRNMVVVDAMCGAGGSTIQLAKTCKQVIAIDIDPKKIALARHNAEIYKVADRIEFIVGDFFEIGPTLKADVVFLSPPWGGPKYKKKSKVVIEDLIGGRGLDLFSLAQKISSNIIFYLPKNINKQQLYDLAGSEGLVELQVNCLPGEIVSAITVYYGSHLMKKDTFPGKSYFHQMQKNETLFSMPVIDTPGTWRSKENELVRRFTSFKPAILQKDSWRSKENEFVRRFTSFEPAISQKNTWMLNKKPSPLKTPLSQRCQEIETHSFFPNSYYYRQLFDSLSLNL